MASENRSSRSISTLHDRETTPRNTARAWELNPDPLTPPVRAWFVLLAPRDVPVPRIAIEPQCTCVKQAPGAPVSTARANDQNRPHQEHSPPPKAVANRPVSASQTGAKQWPSGWANLCVFQCVMIPLLNVLGGAARPIIRSGTLLSRQVNRVYSEWQCAQRPFGWYIFKR